MQIKRICLCFNCVYTLPGKTTTIWHWNVTEVLLMNMTHKRSRILVQIQYLYQRTK